MDGFIFSDLVAIPNQIQVQRHNLISVCRLVVKTLTDNVNIVSIDETSPDLQNLFATLEHIFSHRMKPTITWYGGPEQRYFWDFVKVACKSVPRNCLTSVESMNHPKTPLGKGRAWIRMCLMEKRLSDYVSAALQSIVELEQFYDEGSIMLCEETAILPDILLGLNIMDFRSDFKRYMSANSFDIKGTYLDFPWMLAVNYSKYLKFTHIEGQLPRPMLSTSSDGSAAPAHETDEYANELDELKTNSSKLLEQLKITTEQKRYLDELLRLRELQIEDLTSERKRTLEVIEAEKVERDREKAQFESIIFELQSQLFHLREQTKGLAMKLQEKTRRESETAQNSPGVLMSHLLTREVEEENLNLSLGEELGESYKPPTSRKEDFEERGKGLIMASEVPSKLEEANFEGIVKA